MTTEREWLEGGSERDWLEGRNEVDVEARRFNEITSIGKEPMHIGFSGTQDGMTNAQFQSLSEFIADNPHFVFAHHGDCIGADAEFHVIVEAMGLWTVGHPPIDPRRRAFCNFTSIHEPKEFLDRNKDIVDDSDFMLIGSKGFEEELRSGTWSTARYARKKKVHGLIFWPDGTIEDLIKE